MKYIFEKGETSLIIPVFIQDTSSIIGAGLAGLDQTSSIVGGYMKRNGLGIALAVDENVTTEGTYQAPSTAAQIRIGTPANMRVGTYELHIHNDLLTTADYLLITLGGATNMAPLNLELQLQNFNWNGTAADNLELQYNLTGLSGDTFPSTQAQVGSIATGSGGLSTVADSDTLTTGTETGTVANTEALDGTYHQITPAGGNIEIYYEFDVGTSGKTTSVTWDGYVQSNNDSIAVYGYDWIAAGWVQVGTINGANGTTDLEKVFIFNTSMTGTAANVGIVRCRLLSADATQLFTDRILCEFTSVAQEALIFSSGVAQSGGNNSIQFASGAISADTQFERAKVILISGTGAGQEAIITSTVASTDTATTTPTWLTNPDATTSYEVIPGQTHSTVRNGGYDNGMVYFDSVNGSAGTEKGVNGTSTNPSSSMADLYTIMGVEMITSAFVEPGSVVTLPSNSSGKKFMGSGYSLALNGQEIGNCTFNEAATVSGVGVDTLGANPPNFQLCGMGTCTLPPYTAFQCGWFGVITMGSAGNVTIGGSSEVFNNSLTLDYGAALNASQIFLTSWGGGSVEIQNAGAGTGSYVFEMNGTGDLVVNANCSATTEVTLRGNISRNADVTGVTYVETANTRLIQLQTDKMVFTSAGRIDSNIEAINDSTAGPPILAESLLATEIGTVGSGSHTTTSIATTSLTGLTTDATKYSVVNFTSGLNKGRSIPVTSYTNGTGAMTFDPLYPLANVPLNTDKFTAG